MTQEQTPDTPEGETPSGDGTPKVSQTKAEAQAQAKADAKAEAQAKADGKKAKEETKKTYSIGRSNVRHNGELYPAGGTIELTAAEAKNIKSFITLN